MLASRIYITREQIEAHFNKEEALAALTAALPHGSDKFELEFGEIVCGIEIALEKQLGRELNEQEYPLVEDFVDEFVAANFK